MTRGEIEDLKRFNQVVMVLFKHGFGYFLKKLRLHVHLSVKDRIAYDKFGENAKPEMFRKAFEELGGGFIKLGQFLSLRADLVPKEYCREFRKLQDNVSPFPSEEVAKIIEKELGMPVDNLFSEFDDKPIAAASIGQVHRAKLTTGEEVVVKVQRPKINQIIQEDLDILEYLAKLLDEHHKVDFLNLQEIVKEIKRYTQDELDYTIEAENIRLFFKYNYKDKNIIVPKAYTHISTKKILVMSYIEGEKLNLNEPNKKIASKIINSTFKQVFLDGFFHADPHPGNILVVGNKIAFLDFGIIGKFDEEIKEEMFDLFKATIERDGQAMAEALIALGSVQGDPEVIHQDLKDHFEKYYNKNLEDIKFSEVYYNITEMARKDKLILPIDFVLIGKTVVTAESVAAKLDPTFNLVKAGEPFILQAAGKEYKMKKVMNDIKDNLLAFKVMIKKMPQTTDRVVETMDKADKKLDDIDRDLKIFTSEVDKSSNRIIYTMIFVGLIVASALLMGNTSFILFNISGYSLIGFILAAIFALIIIISIIKEKRFKQ